VSAASREEASSKNLLFSKLGSQLKSQPNASLKYAPGWPGAQSHEFGDLVFTARCYESAVLAMALAVRPSQVGVRLRWLNVGSHKQHNTLAQGIQFSDAKDLREIRPGSPHIRGRQMQVGWVKIGDFPQITGYISKTVQDRRMVSIKVE